MKKRYNILAPEYLSIMIEEDARKRHVRPGTALVMVLWEYYDKRTQQEDRGVVRATRVRLGEHIEHRKVVGNE